MTERLGQGLELKGCTPQPLMLEGLHTGSLGNYFAALGVIRAMSNVETSNEIRGCWKNRCFLLYGIEREALLGFLMKTWRPTAFERWWTKAQSESKKDPNALPRLRASESDERIEQLDAVMVLANRRIFNDIFGTGGNIGKRNLATVWKRSLELSKKPEARSWLEHTLFGVEDVPLPDLQGASTWFVFSNKTFNSGQDWYRDGRLSPWSFLLAVEGAFFLRGGVHQRLGAHARSKAVFPFMCRPMNPSTDGQIGHGHSEFWAPIWSKPATMAEVEMLFGTGLAEVGGQPASAPHEFAVAAMDAAVDAGVASFSRFDLRQTTSTQVFEALPREQISVRRQSGSRPSSLLVPLITSRWTDRLPREPTDMRQRGKFVGLRGPVEAAMIQLAEAPDDPEQWRNLLLLLARTQELVDRNMSLRDRCNPMPRLSPGWFERAWPSLPAELEIARAIASIGTEPRIANLVVDTRSPVLFNIFGLERKGGKVSFPKARPARAVWHDGQPIRVLVEVTRRRLIDAEELDPVPLRGTCPCSINAIASFLSGKKCDDELITRWIPPLALIDWKRARRVEGSGELSYDLPLHPLYTLFRPLLAPDGMAVGGRPLLPLDDDDGRKPHAAAVRLLVNLILQDDVDQAVDVARRRYLAAGWRTIAPPPGEMRMDCERLVAALLVPANPSEVARRFVQDWLVDTKENG